MKNLFIISEEEKKRILGLHESATKRHYLSEQESEETKLRKSLNPIANEITMIVPGSRFVNVDETKLINTILKIPDVSTLNAVNNDLKRYYANKTIKYSGLDAVIADSIGAFDSGKERLRPHLQKLLGRNSTQNLGTSNFKFPDLSVIMANQIQQQRDTASQNTKTNTTTQQQNKDNNTTQKTADTGKANLDTTQVKQTPCPVGSGTTEEIKLFQDWLDSKVTGWLPKYPDGLKKDTKKGYGMCGPNTRKAWTQYGEQYKTNPEQNVAVSSKPFTPQQGEDDVVIPDNTTAQGVANPNQSSQGYVEGGKYDYVLIDKNGNEVTTPKVTLPTGSYDSSNKEIIRELPSKGSITVKQTHSGGDLVSAFPNGLTLDLQSNKNEPNIFNHPNLYGSNLKVKLIPKKSEPIRSTGRGSGLASMEFDQFNQP